ncbi:hypothetical protein LINGRAHAP2_LOCUS16448 [Linum grandiflorum]
MTGTRDWASLPEGILDSILSNLFSLQDYLRFSCVCKPWFSVAGEQKRLRIATSHKQVPFLLVPTKNRSGKRRSLFNAAGEGKLLDSNWLVFLEKDYRVTLYNPFTKSEISLPSIGNASYRRYHEKHYQYFAKKVILSADPSLYPDDYLVAGLIDDPFRTLVLIRPGRDTEWTHFTKWSNYVGLPGLTFDVMFDKSGKWVYASGHGGMLARASVDTSVVEPVIDLVVGPWGPTSVCVQTYLVETTSESGDMLMILRFFEEQEGYEFSMETNDIKVYKLQDHSRFVEVEDLDGDAVFIGDNYSTAVSAKDVEGIEANCVYYSDDFVEFLPNQYYYFGPHDIGKFDVKSRTFGTHYVPTRTQNRGMPPPIWIFPTLKPMT